MGRVLSTKYCLWSCSNLSECLYSFSALHTCNVGWEGVINKYCLWSRSSVGYEHTLLVIPLQCGLWTRCLWSCFSVGYEHTLLVILLQCGLWTHTACDPASVWVMHTACDPTPVWVMNTHCLWSRSSVGYEHTVLVILLQCGYMCDIFPCIPAR